MQLSHNKSDVFKMQLSHNKNKTRLVFTIIGGDDADIHKYPYSARYGTTCAAVIIGERWAITAAHCNAFSYVRVGSHYDKNGTKIQVKTYFNHPGWTRTPKANKADYDFRLLKLNESFNFNDPNIKPIKIGYPSDVVVGKLVTVTGWGNTKYGGPPSQVLQAVKIPIVTKKDCEKMPKLTNMFEGSITPRMFCAGYKEGLKDACQGDSGGPAVANDRLLGTVSFGYGCATPYYYGVYANVAVVRDWIMAITGLHLD